MKPVSTQEIVKRLENIKPGEKLKLITSRTFGEYTVILELNPAWPKKGEKRYHLRVGKSESEAGAGKPFFQSDKAKKVASWPGERWCQWLTEDISPEKAA
jgi:hypothetical protein